MGFLKDYFRSYLSELTELSPLIILMASLLVIQGSRMIFLSPFLRMSMYNQQLFFFSRQDSEFFPSQNGFLCFMI